MFYVGQKVVCVDASNSPGLRWDVGEAPVEGRVYTVSRVRKPLDPTREGMLVLGFCELERSARVRCVSLAAASGTWAGYVSRRFRPVADRKTDISALVKIAEEAARTGKVLA